MSIITFDAVKAFRFEVTGKETPEPSERGGWTPTTYDERLATSAIRAIPNNEMVPYETYRNLGFAMNAVNPEREVLLAEFERWASQYPGHEPGDGEMIWDAADPDGGIGPGTLFYHAEQAGWDRTEALIEIISLDMEKADGDRKALEAFYKIIAGANITDAGREALTNRLAERMAKVVGGSCKKLVKKAIGEEIIKLRKANRPFQLDMTRYPEMIYVKVGEVTVERPDPKSQRNVLHLLKRMGITLHRDVFFQETRYETTEEPDKVKPVDQQLLLNLLDQAHVDHFRAEQDFISVQIEAIALRDKRDPVRDYFDELPEWDRKERLNTCFQRLMGAPDCLSVREVLPLVMRAMVRRTYQPGCKFDLMPILEGPQGLGKSSFFRILMPIPDWFGEGPKMSTEEKRLLAQLGGKLVTEFAELAGMNKQNIDAIKKLITQQTDEYIANYDRKKTRAPRRCVFVGSVNGTQYLRDLTDNRRFPIVPVTKELNYEALKKERDQLWAEAIWMEQCFGGELRLSPDAVEDMKTMQQSRLDVNSEAAAIISQISCFKEGYLSTETIWARIGIGYEDRAKRTGQAQYLYKEVKDMMEKDGWQWNKSLRTGDGVESCIFKRQGRGPIPAIVLNGGSFEYATTPHDASDPEMADLSDLF